jgi:hypothetical protein
MAATKQIARRTNDLCSKLRTAQPISRAFHALYPMPAAPVVFIPVLREKQENIRATVPLDMMYRIAIWFAGT